MIDELPVAKQGGAQSHVLAGEEEELVPNQVNDGGRREAATGAALHGVVDGGSLSRHNAFKRKKRLNSMTASSNETSARCFGKT
eukprot:CAMPEP_0176094600 /NCGR_PEP_ID=MMETSP0120_2-20121206/47404_1 /TAXON_ID=160619 /ORGANISM="Kryptoperidinium foliaceum, Strain CCMP 1326" /LENGTH=83 /DNA_ID=CAMNT_0017428541 /DNA_START=345 /DNA_END=597 /DNA_ORIENTATION=+